MLPLFSIHKNLQTISFFTFLAKLTEAAMKNLWALVQDNEYVLAKLYEDYELFPKVYGTCGGLYAVEHLEPLTFPSIFGKSR